MFARAGRRAGLAPEASSGFDPLSAPPPPAPVEPEPEPEAASAAGGDAPNWLDDDADTKPQATKTAVPAATTAPVAPAPPQGVTPPATSTASPAASDSRPRVPAYVPPWAKTPQKVPPLAPTSLAPTPLAQPAAESPMKAPTPLAKFQDPPPPPAPAPVAPVPGANTSVGAERLTPKKAQQLQTESTPVASAAAPSATAALTPLVAPSGPSFASSGAVQQLREKLAQLEAQERAVVNRCSELLAKPSASTSVESRAKQSLFETKRLELTNNIYKAKTAHREAVDAAMKHRAERLLKIRTESHETRVEKARAQLNGLAAQVAKADAEVRELRRDLQGSMRGAAEGVQPSAEEKCATELSKQIHTLFACWRHAADTKSVATLREATRARLLDVSAEQQRIHDQGRGDRGAALRKHLEQRQEAFSVFRRARRDGRKHAADAFFASLKMTRERHLRETIAATSSVAVRHEREIEESAAIARAEAKASLERAMARHRTAAQDEWISMENQLRRREAAIEEEQAHKRKLFEHDRAALVRRNGLEIQAWTDAAASKKSPTAIGQLLSGELKQQRKRIKDTFEAAVIAVKGIDAARKLPSTFKANLTSRESALATIKQAVQVKAGSLTEQWGAVAASIQQLNELLSRLHDKAAMGRSDVTAAQQRLDAVRTAWEKEERSLLNRSELPTADNAHADVIYDIASQLREVTEKQNELRRERGDYYGRTIAAEDDVEHMHAEFAKQFFALLGKYDEVATALAAVEGKRRHLDNEAEDQRMARAGLDQEWKEAARTMERLHVASEQARKDAAVVAAAERRASASGGVGGPAFRAAHGDSRFPTSALTTSQRREGEASRWADFSTLIRLPDDSSTGTTSWSTARPAGTAPSGSITTPSPDTDG